MRWMGGWGAPRVRSRRSVGDTVAGCACLVAPPYCHDADTLCVRCFPGPGALPSTGPPLLTPHHAPPSLPSSMWALCCPSRHPRTRVYVSYWYYKRPDIPSGVRRRPAGRDKSGGELFFSTHLDENKVQTLMGHCKVYGRPMWLDRGLKTAPLHTYYCSKVYDLQGQYVRGFAWGVGVRRVLERGGPFVPRTCLVPFGVVCWVCTQRLASDCGAVRGVVLTWPF